MKYGRIVSAALLAMGLSTAAFAHELVMKPQKMDVEKGGTLAVEIHSGHKFIVPEEVEDAERIKAGVFKDGKLQEAELKPNEKNLCIDFSVPAADDGSMVILANKDGGVWCTTNEGGKSGTRKELEAQGLKVVKATKNDKFVKAIVNASKDDKNFATETGQWMYRKFNHIRLKLLSSSQESVELTCMNTWMDQFLFRQKQSMSTLDRKRL